MSTRQDILRAKARYEAHRSEHKCVLLNPCAERARLWALYIRTAGLWGREIGDM